jgi:hypothetical protein
MCSRRFASLGEGGRKAEWDPPGLFYSLPRRKASKNDAKPGHCVAIALWTYGIWGAISFLDCERRPSESLTWGVSRQGMSSLAHKFISCGRFGIQGPSPIARPGGFLSRSTSHSVAARDGCTKIPLAAGGAREDETILNSGFLRPWLTAVRLPGSARTDQVLEDWRIR